jgi:hypothetical protein
MKFCGMSRRVDWHTDILRQNHAPGPQGGPKKLLTQQQIALSPRISIPTVIQYGHKEP